MAVINTVDSALAGRTASALAVVETASGRELFRREQPVDFVSAAFSPGNRFLVTAQADGTVALRDVRRDSLLWQRSVTGNIVSVLFSPDGRRVWVAGDSLVGLDAAGGERFWLRRPEEAAQVAVLSPDGQWLAVAGSDGPVYLYRPGTREPVVRFAGEDGTVLHLQLGKDSRSLASVTTNGTAVVWDVGERKPVTTLKTEEMLSPVAFSPAGTYLALGTDPLARVWRLPGGTEEIRIPHANFVKSIAFSPDERRLATADADGTIRISWLRPADLIEAACERLLDNIPAEERAEYGGSGELDTVCPGDEGKAQRVAERGRKRSDE
jgi:WD40 repeat protein